MANPHAMQVVDFDGTEIKGLSRRNFRKRPFQMAQASSGTLHQTGHKPLGGAPMLELTTIDMADVWSILSGGADVPYNEVSTGLKWYYAQGNDAADGVGYKAGSTHDQYLAAKAGLVLSRLSYAPKQYAEMDLQAFLWDGSGDGNTQPWAESAVALPTVPAWDDGCVMDTLTVGGVSVTEGLVSMELSIDHKIENNDPAQCYYNGRPWPVRLAKPGPNGAIGVVMTLVLQGIDLAVASGDVVAVFKDVTAAGALDSNSYQVSLNGLVEPMRDLDDTSQAPTTMAYICRGYYDGSNLPLTLS